MTKRLYVDFDEFEARMRKAGLLDDDEFIYVTYDDNRSMRVGIGIIEDEEDE